MPKKGKDFGHTECRHCSRKFKRTRKIHIYCSSKCRVDEWVKTHPRFLVRIT